jgi:hypothetical protein
MCLFETQLVERQSFRRKPMAPARTFKLYLAGLETLGTSTPSAVAKSIW